MKTRSWILLFSVIFLFCAILSAIFFLGGRTQSTAEVYSDGTLVLTLNLSVDGEYRVENGAAWNILSVAEGKVCVASASCASQDCVHHSPANSGAPIVCLPNRLVIRFSDAEAMDAIVG